MKRILIFCALTLVIAPGLEAQKTECDSALALRDAGKYAEAALLMEKLVADGTADRAIYERLGFHLLSTSAALADINDRKQQRSRARSMLAKAVELGSKDIQTQEMLKIIPEDGGSDFVFSKNKDVDSAMRRGEAAFAKKEWTKARTEYHTALNLDPTSYAAALFIGDTHFNDKKIDSAYFWYGRATAIDPNKETAWRYWSDVLLKNKSMDEAREKAVEAMVAEPYNRLAGNAISVWASTTKTRVFPPSIEFPPKDGKGGTPAARTAYESIRSAWKSSGSDLSAPFKAAYPDEGKYRHSLAEELQAMRAAYKTGGGERSIDLLKQLDDAGVLEGFILVFRADEGIAKDYDAYRRANRDKVRELWMKFVIGAPYAK